MSITIELIYKCRGMNVIRGGSFAAKGRTSEKVADDWIQEIKKEMDIDKIVSVISDGKEDITEKVLNMQKAPLD